MKHFFLILILASFGARAQQTINGTIMHGGVQRSYILYVPASYSSAVESPLLFCFHGYTSNASIIKAYSNFDAVADTANVIVVYPQGTLLNGNTHWNVGGWTTGSTADDIGFTNALLDSLNSQYTIDSTRVYSTGMSNGGYMSMYLACESSGRFAAVASVTGSMTPGMFNNCNPQHPTPVMQIHGTTDQTVPYNGDPTWTKSIPDVLTYWSTYNNCDPTPITTAVPNTNVFDGSTVEHIMYQNGDNCTKVEHYKVIGGDHDWPGAWGNFDISATNEVWNFLSQFTINGIEGCTASIEENVISGLTIYPNPITDILKIESTSIAGDYAIYSAQGEKVASGILTLGSNSLDLSELAPEVYFLKVNNETMKIVKVK